MKEKSGCGLKKNDLFELTIEDIGSEGEGIGKYDGFTFFVKDAVTGDRIQAQVLKVNKNYGFAKVVRILTPSPQRVEPMCPVARQCGGCQLQHVSYAEQLRYKADKVKNCLVRIGGISEPCMESILGMEEPFYYRNKAQFPVGCDKNGEPVIGFYAGRTHHIIATETCCIQAKLNRCLMKTFRAFLKKYAIAPYHEEDGTGLVRHVLTRIGFATGEVMVCPVINGNSMPHATELVEMLQQAVEQYQKEEQYQQEEKYQTEEQHRREEPYRQAKQESTVYHLTSVCFNINKEKTNVILGERIVPFFGETYITDYIGDVCFRISPLSFYQVNPIQTKVLYEQALTYAGLTGEETVWDLYCGIGTISLFLAGRAKKVYGVEIVPQAISDARENAKLNGINNAEFFVGAAEEVLPEQYKKSGGTMRADVIVVDPPRKGCAESLLDTIVAMEPDRVVYV